VTNFGAFIDIGVHQDGLVHISHLSDKFVKDPKEVVAVAQKVKATVVEVDVARKRIGLSMKSNPFAEQPMQQQQKSSAPKGKPNTKSGSAPKRDFKSSKPSKPKEKEMSMEEKLALLKEKFKK
jgi:uncharacterized protein